MSFSINLGGTAGEALASLEAVIPPSAPEQFQLVKDFLVSHINTFPSDGLLSISASGHHYGVNGSLTLSISHTTPPAPAQAPSTAVSGPA